MSERERQHSGAIRIFEALSGVDEELLERSEEKKAKIFRWRYGRVAAAALCFVITGVTIWGVNSKSPAFEKNETSMADGADCAAADVQEMEAAEEADREGIKQEEVTELTNGTESDGVTQGSQESATDLKQEEIVTESAMTTATDAITEEITEEEAGKVARFGDYVPTVLPEGYVWESGRVLRDAESDAVVWMVLVWTRGSESICFTIEGAESEEADSQDGTIPVFAAEEFDLDYIPEGSFSVIYEDDVRVSVSGSATVEDIRTMWESLPAN